MRCETCDGTGRFTYPSIDAQALVEVACPDCGVLRGMVLPTVCNCTQDGLPYCGRPECDIDWCWCCSDCEWEGVEIVHRPMCARWQSAEIAEVADRIANGHATCGATWRDTEATGWLWYCSLPVGHAGHHRCVGASW